MKKFPALLCVLAMAATAVTAHAQPAFAQDSSTRAQREALAQRYLVAMHIDTSIQALLNAMMPAMLSQMLKDKPNLTTEERNKIVKAVSEATSDAMTSIQPDYNRAAAEVISSTYSVDELNVLLTLYESPMGQAIVAKQSQMAGHMSQVMIGLMPRLQDMIKQRICEKLGCGVAPTGPQPGPA